MPAPSLYIGLMSGTSLDGIDCCLVDFNFSVPRLVGSTLYAFPDQLKADLVALQKPADNEIHRAAQAGNALAHAFAKSINVVLSNANIRADEVVAIGMHGQTIRHRPEAGYTTQIGNAALLAELTGIDVVADFRSRDVAAGGQGAPLVPAFHHGMFASDKHRVIANVGGIANLTDLKPGGIVRGWDTGPGNVLMDTWISRHCQQAYDADGKWAASGRAIPRLLEVMLSEPYFSLAPPKSTGRDLFDCQWLDIMLKDIDAAAEDIQATLMELTAKSIANSLLREAADAEEVYVCGGGARNSALMQRLSALLAPRLVSTTELLSLHPDWVEAVAFAWLAKQTISRQTGNLPAVTGARGTRILGAIYPA